MNDDGTITLELSADELEEVRALLGRLGGPGTR